MAPTTRTVAVAVICCSLLIFSPGALATTIVAVFRKTPAGGPSIVLGADGLLSLISDEGRPIEKTPECKIRRASQYYYAIAGLVFSPDRSYDAYREANRILSQNGSFAEKTKGLEETMLREMNSVTSWPSGVPNVIQLLIVNSAEFPEYYFGHFDKDDDGRWRIAPPPAPRSEIRCSLAEGFNTRIVILGNHDHIRKDDMNQPDTPVEAIRRLIGIEEKQHPDLVGEPISIIEFDGKGGVSWIQAGACRP